MHVKVTGRLHLEAVHGLAGVRVNEVVAPGGHRFASPFLYFEPWLAYILAAHRAYMRMLFMQILTPSFRRIPDASLTPLRFDAILFYIIIRLRNDNF